MSEKGMGFFVSFNKWGENKEVSKKSLIAERPVLSGKGPNNVSPHIRDTTP